MYRPEDWKNPWAKEWEPYGNDITRVPCSEAYEAGADAILEMLKGEGVFTYGHHTPDIELDDAKEESGYWVFIPNEEEQ